MEDRPGKAQWRHRLRMQRRGLRLEQVQACSQAIGMRLMSLEVMGFARRVGLYHAMEQEVDIFSFLLQPSVLKPERELYLPVVVAKEMQFVRYRPGDALAPGAYGILEPVARLEPPLVGQGVARLDVLLMPLVGFDRQGGRLGYGGGYYDRLLAPWQGKAGGGRPVLIGMAYAFQEVAQLPRQAHDVGLDYVVTEQAVYAFPDLLAGESYSPVP